MAGEQITITVNGVVEYQGDATTAATLAVVSDGDAVILIETDPILVQKTIYAEINQSIEGIII